MEMEKEKTEETWGRIKIQILEQNYIEDLIKMVINLNPTTLTNANGNTSPMAIISHAVIDDVVYMHVVCPGDEISKWVTLEEALELCPAAVIAYTQLTLTHIFGPPLEDQEPSLFD
ncbi:hypothetical protein ACLKA7_006968 [Drosophila subpalustris]